MSPYSHSTPCTLQALAYTLDRIGHISDCHLERIEEQSPDPKIDTNLELSERTVLTKNETIQGCLYCGNIPSVPRDPNGHDEEAKVAKQ